MMFLIGLRSGLALQSEGWGMKEMSDVFAFLIFLAIVGLIIAVAEVADTLRKGGKKQK